MNIELQSIKSAAVIDYSYHVFKGEMCFQIHALITFYCVRSTVSFTESIACKRFNLPPYFPCHLIAVIFLLAIVEELFLDFLKFFPASVFSTHSSSKHISFA